MSCNGCTFSFCIALHSMLSFEKSIQRRLWDCYMESLCVCVNVKTGKHDLNFKKLKISQIYYWDSILLNC